MSLKTEKQILQVRKSYYWFIYDGLKKTILMKPLVHLESEQRVRYENINYLIENKECFCDNGFLHPIKTRNGKYTPETFYNHMK